MCEKNFAFWWFCTFLFIPSSFNHQQNITNNEEVDNLTMQYELNENSKINFTSQRIYRDLIGIEGNNDATSYETFDKTSNGNDNKYNIVPYEMCANITCIPLCCPLGNRLDDKNNKCISENITHPFPKVYTNDSLQSEKKVDELFQLTVYDPCIQTDDNHSLLPNGYENDYKIFTNGSIYLSYYKKFVKSTPYCLAVVEGINVEVALCVKTSNEIKSENTNKLIESNKIIFVSFHIVCILFLVPVFLVYSILPELRNVHGFMLRNYSGALSVAYTIDIVTILIKADVVQYPVCLTVAFFTYFCFFTSFLWLTIMSFDMWWTFRGLCSLQKNINQGEKKKLVFYVIYAWSLPFILAVTPIIMDSVSENLPQLLRPEFRAGNCWFLHKGSFALYYYWLKSVCVISSICLSISTAVKIARYEKDTSRHLTNSESKQYNNNKKWFNLYLKLFILLFIVMGIKWSVMTISLFEEIMSLYFSYIINVVDILQNFCVFIIFVWKKKIKLMLQKRFSCGLFPEAPSTNVTSLNSISSTPGETSMQKKVNKRTVTRFIR